MSEATKTPAKTKTAWKKRQVHTDITLPSGQLVDIKVPNLPQLLKSGQVPNTLVDAAVQTQSATKITRELIESTWDFYRWLVAQTVVSPELEESDVEDLPTSDIELIVSLATRQTDLDAVGHQLGGLETQRAFRDFRGLLSTDETRLGL